LHHPSAVVAEYRQACSCRKPNSGLLIKAAKEMDLELIGSYMVGDQPRDMFAGKTAGCTTVFVGFQLPEEAGIADHLCMDLNAASRLITQLESPVSASRKQE
jgi:D-glycero-D-manno-heptose 1,7-bisphosphate phosphatase